MAKNKKKSKNKKGKTNKTKAPSFDRKERQEIDSRDFASGISMNLFGSPYQFGEQVDPRDPDRASSIVGTKFTENIMLEAPVFTYIPGRPMYMPGAKKNVKYTATTAFLKNALDNDDSMINEFMKNNPKENWRLYDFQLAYNEYMDYVNMLCRVGATYLGLTEEIQTLSGNLYAPQQMDWRNWHWTQRPADLNEDGAESYFNSEQGEGGIKMGKVKTGYGGSGIKWDAGNVVYKTKRGLNGFSHVAQTFNYVQFYIDPDVASPESMSNNTAESSLLSGLSTQGSSLSREVQFLAGVGGNAGLAEFGEKAGKYGSDAFNSIADVAGQVASNAPFPGLRSSIKRILNLGGEVIKGNNLVIPEIYQTSSRQKSYTITVHLKTPYGNKYSYYMDIYVPLMHLLALSIPRQSTANSYSEPFIFKGSVNGHIAVSLGIVEDISIARSVETMSMDGLPTEVDVTLSIKDLYADLSMSSSRQPYHFMNNPSLVEYLATACGVSMLQPNYERKVDTIVQTVGNYFRDTPTTAMGDVKDQISSKIFARFGWGP